MNDRNSSGLFNLQMRKHLLVFVFIVLAALAALVGRIVYINKKSGAEYEKKVLSQLSGYDSVVLPYKRGSILDSKGTTLATCEKVYNVKLSTKDISYYIERDKNEGLYQATADALATCFGVNASDLVAFMRSNPDNTYKLVAKRVAYEEVEQFNEMVKAAKENKEANNIYGVAFDEEYIRSYPNGSMAADVIGFTNDGNEGSYGLEQYYNDTLNGTDGRMFGYLNENSNMEKTTIPAVDGQTLVTTIDANIQRIVEEKMIALNESLRDNAREGLGSNNTGVIVMECDTGNILAMASYPTFDLNDERKASSYYTPEELARIKEKLTAEKLAKMENGGTVITDLTEAANQNQTEKTSMIQYANGQASTIQNPKPGTIQAAQGLNPDGTLATGTDVNQGDGVNGSNQPDGNTNTENTGNADGTAEGGYVNQIQTDEFGNPMTQAVQELVTDADVDDYARALRWSNFCIQSTYEPGSVAKPFTVACGLDSGKMTGNEVYFCGGNLEVGGFKIKCHNRFGDGQMSVENAIAQSCNVALMRMGMQIGTNTFLDYFRRFNFGYKTNIDLAGEAKTNTLVFNENTMGPTELATSTFGQGFSVTMIEMVAAFNSIINGGYYYQPHMVSQILDGNGAVVRNIEPCVLKQTVSNSTSEKIVSYCNAVVTNGTGKKARPAGYAIGGKTGTAETFPRDKHDYVTSFMGYAPAEDPKIIVYVVLDRPNLPDQQGGTALACTMTKDILTEVLPYMNIFMTEELTDAEKEDLISKGLYNEAIYRPVHREDAGGDSDGISVVLDDKDIQIDKETGYAIDPETGEFLDPETGYPISPSSDLPDFSVRPEATDGSVPTDGTTQGTTTQGTDGQFLNADGTTASTIQNYTGDNGNNVNSDLVNGTAQQGPDDTVRNRH